MDYALNADEIFEMAEQIERNGATFYRSASERIERASSKKLLHNLAAMEVEHERIFASLRAQLTDKEKKTNVFDPEEETILYLQALADAQVFQKKEIDVTSEEKILEGAIGAEKDSIVFYLGMKNMIPEDLGKTRIEGIIREEMAHLRLLNAELVALKR
jgi:rubrerythrin